MEKLISDRLVLRGWLEDDWKDLLEISLDWKSQPGPEFDKFPVDEEGCRKFNEYNVKQGNGFAVYLRSEEKVIGLLAINGLNEHGQMDLGHIFHSKYLNNDIDKEALSMGIDYIFKNFDAKAIITNNDPDEKQNAPLYSLGFTDRNKNGGQLITEKNKWLNMNNL